MNNLEKAIKKLSLKKGDILVVDYTKVELDSLCDVEWKEDFIVPIIPAKDCAIETCSVVDLKRALKNANS